MSRRPLDALTSREKEVLALLRRGLTNEEIARRLGISLDGAKYHVSQILSKLRVATREEAAAFRPGERRWWWMQWPAWVKIGVGAGVLAAAAGLFGVIAITWDVGSGAVEDDQPDVANAESEADTSRVASPRPSRAAHVGQSATPQPSPVATPSPLSVNADEPYVETNDSPQAPTTTSTAQPTSPTATPVADGRPRLHRMLVAEEDLPPEFQMVREPLSVVPVDQAPYPPNALVQYELALAPGDPSAISCLKSYVVELPNEAEAIRVFELTKQRHGQQTGMEGQSVERIDVPLTGDESSGSTLLSTRWEIGACGTRPVYAYAEMAFRRGSILAYLTGFAPRDRPSAQLVVEVAQKQLARIDGVLAAP